MKLHHSIYFFWTLVVLSLITRCSPSNLDRSELPPPLYHLPESHPLNKDQGYAFNTLTGDSIIPITQPNGAILPTNASVPAIGKKITIADQSIIEKSKLGTPRTVDFKSNQFKRDQAPKRIKINPQKLKVRSVGIKHNKIYFLNEMGDTIPTGVPIAATPIVNPIIQPVPRPGLAPRYKEVSNQDIKYMDEGQGISSSRIRSVMHDRRGDVWLGTWASGLDRYDGTRVTNYTINEGLAGNIIFVMLEDSNGHLWFGTYLEGIIRFDGHHLYNYSTQSGLSNNRIREIFEDSKGTIWIGSEGGGLTSFDGDSFTHYTVNEGLSSNRVTAIEEDSEGNLWVGTEDNGLNKFNGQTFTIYNSDHGLNGNSILDLMNDSAGHLWITYQDNGVSVFDGDFFEQYSTGGLLENRTVWCVFQDRKGDIWFGLDGQGVVRYDGQTWTGYTKEQGLSDEVIWDLAEDSKGNIWMATRDGGVNIFNPQSFLHISIHEGLSNNNVRSILEDDKGNYWFPTWGGGINKFDGQTLSHYTTREGFASNDIWCITQDQNGTMWIGTLGEGIIAFDDTSIKQFKKLDGFTSHDILSSLIDQSGNLWFGTDNGGIYKYDGEGFIRFSTVEGLSGDIIWSFIEDQEGNFWLPTWGGGVSKFDGKEFTYYTEREGLSFNDVWSVLEDRNGNIWFGTYGRGISIFDGQRFTHLTTREGLPNNIITSLVQDDHGTIWAGTEKGLAAIAAWNPASTDSLSNPKIISFTNMDGLKGSDFNVHATYIDKDNRVWWGTGKSLAYLDLDRFALPTDPPQIHLDHLEINGQFKDFQNEDSKDLKIAFDSVPAFYNYPIDPILPHTADHLTFHFAAKDWGANHQIKYSYKLAGLNDDWSSPSIEPKVDYRNLPHGDYTFLVSAIGKAQVWSPPVAFDFKIMAPWWYRWWAYLIYALIFYLGIRSYFSYRSRVLIQQNKELESRVHERTDQLNQSLVDLKTTQAQLIHAEKMASLGQLTSGIAHEIQNPLNFVNNFSELSGELLDEMNEEIQKGNTKEIVEIIADLRQNMEKIHIHGDRASSIVKSMLEHSKTASGERRSTDINALCRKYLGLSRSNFESTYPDAQITVTSNFLEDLPPVEVVPQALGKVLINLLHNAFYAVREKSLSISNGYSPEIIVTTEQNKNAIEIRVADNGTGIPKDEMDKIFQPFYTTKPTGQGTGLGLSMAYNIVKVHGGELDVETEQGKRTEFKITIPKA